jgi:hypothetical protein
MAKGQNNGHNKEKKKPQNNKKPKEGNPGRK